MALVRWCTAIALVLLAGCPGASPAVDVPDAGSPVVPATPDATPGGPDAAPPCQPSESGEQRWQVAVGDDQREVIVFVPTAYDGCRAVPLLINLHALGSSAALQEAYTRTTPAAEREGFVVVYPEGIGGSWNAGPGCCGAAQAGNVDDVSFLAGVLDEVQDRLRIDRERIYVTGMSNGAYMSYRVACELSDRVAAIAAVAGADVAPACGLARPVPVLHIHGTLDTIVPYAGGVASLGKWIERNGCGDERTVTYDQLGTRCEQIGPCADDVEVVLCTVSGGAHVWPGGVASPAGIDATDAVWTFLSRQRLTAR